MESENAHRNNGEHEHSSLDSSADCHQSNYSCLMDSSDLATTDGLNGDPQHNLSLPESSESKHGDLAGEIDRSTAVNQVLVDEIASLRDTHADKEQTREVLEAELHGICERAEALSAEVASLAVEKKRQEDMAVCMVQDAEKMDLLVENGKIVAENKSLDASCAEVREKLSLLTKDLDEKRVAMAAVQTRVHVVCFEIEKLQLEKEEYSKEVSLLDASNSTIDAQIGHLREQEQALSNEIDHVLATRALAKQKVSDAQATIAALGMQISILTENDEDMKKQLREANERLEHLQVQDSAMAVRERDMETRIMDLESELYTLRGNFAASHQTFERENEAKEGMSRTQDVALMKVTAFEREIHVLNTSSRMQETDVNAKQLQQHVKDLETQVAHLREENEALASSNEKLETVLKAQEDPKTEGSNQMKEDIKTLEGALNEALEQVRVSELKEIQMKLKVQELTILAKRNPRLAGLITPLVISGGTIVALGLLVFLLRSNSKSKSC